jgi:hypothetical protein
MRQVMVRYKVKPEQVARNEELVQRVYDELRQTAPAGLHYATFVLEDGVSFVHVASSETADGGNPLTDVEAFRAFQEGIGDRCDEPPVAVGLRQVGAYRFWADEGNA